MRVIDFINQVKIFSKKVQNMKDNIQTEEATKTSIIMPFFLKKKSKHWTKNIKKHFL